MAIADFEDALIYYFLAGEYTEAQFLDALGHSVHHSLFDLAHDDTSERVLAAITWSMEAGMCGVVPEKLERIDGLRWEVNRLLRLAYAERGWRLATHERCVCYSQRTMIVKSICAAVESNEQAFKLFAGQGRYAYRG